jgi:hypothetical protein
MIANTFRAPLSRTLQLYRHFSNMSFPSKIQAITFAKTGGVDVIEKTEQPFPQQLPGEILVKVIPLSSLLFFFLTIRRFSGQVWRRQLYRHLLSLRRLPRDTPVHRRTRIVWHSRRSAQRPSHLGRRRIQKAQLFSRYQCRLLRTSNPFVLTNRHNEFTSQLRCDFWFLLHSFRST